MTRDLEHPYLPGGLAAFFFASALENSRLMRFGCLAAGTRGLRMASRYTTWEQIQPLLLLFALFMIGLFASLE